MDHHIRNLVHTAETSDEIIDWKLFTRKRPKVLLNVDSNYTCDDPKDKERIKGLLKKKFGVKGNRAGKPSFVTGPNFTDANVAKDLEVLSGWIDSARDTRSIEMEIAGVHQAAIRGGYVYPILMVRGISDVVGFKREPEWIRYACDSAAFVFKCLLQSGGDPLRKLLTRRQPDID